MPALDLSQNQEHNRQLSLEIWEARGGAARDLLDFIRSNMEEMPDAPRAPIIPRFARCDLRS